MRIGRKLRVPLNTRNRQNRQMRIGRKLRVDATTSRYITYPVGGRAWQKRTTVASVPGLSHIHCCPLTRAFTLF